MSEDFIPYGNPKEKKETFTYEELTYSNYLTIEALGRLLIKKGIITEREIFIEINKIQQEDKELRDKKNNEC